MNFTRTENKLIVKKVGTVAYLDLMQLHKLSNFEARCDLVKKVIERSHNRQIDREGSINGLSDSEQTPIDSSLEWGCLYLN